MAQVTLKRCDQVISCSRLTVSELGDFRTPLKPIFISRGILKEFVLLMGGVTTPAPCCPTCGPGSAAGRKVAAKEAPHLLQNLSTLLAPSDPVPKLERLILTSMDRQKGRGKGTVAYGAEEHIAFLCLVSDDPNAFNSSESSSEWKKIYQEMCKTYCLY